MLHALMGDILDGFGDDDIREGRDADGLLHVDGEAIVVIVAPLTWGIAIDAGEDAIEEFVIPENVWAIGWIVLKDGDGITECGTEAALGFVQVNVPGSITHGKHLLSRCERSGGLVS
jgi:hypothetical protein